MKLNNTCTLKRDDSCLLCFMKISPKPVVNNTSNALPSYETQILAK